MTPACDAILDRLAVLTRDIEAHESAAWLLKHERGQLRMQLASIGWQAPTVPVVA